MHGENGVNATHIVGGVGHVIFQLELEGHMEVANVYLILELRNKFLLVSYLEDNRYAVLQCNAYGIIYPL